MPLSDNTRGALLMMASMAAFTFNDAFMKSLAGTVPLFQLLFLRGVMTSAMTGGWALKQGAYRVKLPAKDWGLVALRVIAEVGAAYFFLTALFVSPLANVTAILQSLPLTVTLAASILFGEAIGWRRMSAIFVGFLGVLLIIRPGPDGFDINSIYVLIAVAFITMRDLATRRLSPEVPSMLVTSLSAVGVMVFFGLGALGQEWVSLDSRAWAVTALAALMVMGGYMFSVMVMRVGEISFIAPFRYTSLVWALLLGWLVFGDWPDPVTLLGAAIVVGSGMFMLYREGQIARRKKRQNQPVRGG